MFEVQLTREEIVHGLLTTRVKHHGLKDAILLKPDIEMDEMRTIAKAFEIKERSSFVKEKPVLVERNRAHIP